MARMSCCNVVVSLTLVSLLAPLGAVAATVTLVSPEQDAVVNQATVDFRCSAEDADGLQRVALYVGTLGDESTLSFSGAQDAQLRADLPDVAYGTEPSLNVDGENPHAHAVLRFASIIGDGLDQIPAGATIRSATLEVKCFNLGAVMLIYRLLKDWDENTVTWNRRDANTLWADPGADGLTSRTDVGYPADCSSAGTKSIDLTAMVQDWANGAANFGMLLTDGGTDGVDVDSSEGAQPPVLTVTFAPFSGLTEAANQELSDTTAAEVAFLSVPVPDGTRQVWNCLAEDTLGNQSWSDLDAEFFLDVHLPDEPVVIAPPTGSLGVSPDPTLEVTVSDPDLDALDVTFLGRSTSTEAAFTLVVLPDTQKYVLNDGLEVIYQAQTQWIADEKDARNIVFVSHMGDLVETYNDVSQWDESRYAMSLLDGVVPYGVLPGNHDQPSTLYNQYFPYTDYDQESWYGGHHPAVANDNNYQLFSAGGLEFIVLHLGFDPDAEAIAWADGVLKAHPDHKAILSTHAFLDAAGIRNVHVQGDAEYIWDGLVVPNPNVFFVLCGHVHAEVLRTDEVDGRLVHQLLADYQSLDNGGQGYLRIMRFEPAENKVYVETYSPYLDSLGQNAYQTDANSQFSLDFPMSTFRELGEVAGVASGGTASLAWPDRPLDTPHEWSVTVADPSGRTRTGPTWTFHTTANDGVPPAISGVQAQDVTDRSARIAWVTDEPADSLVEYQVDGGDLLAVTDSALEVDHEILLSGLSAGTVVDYQVTSQDSSANVAVAGPFTFSTLAVNQPPEAAGQEVTTYEDTDVSVTLHGSDPDGDPLTFRVVDPPTRGTLGGVMPDLLYTPDADVSGPDTFTFAVSDGNLESLPGTVSITVIPVNDPPAVPQGLVASVSPGRVDLDWEDNLEAEGDLAGYKVYRATDLVSYGFLEWVVESTYADIHVVNDVTYAYAVTAVDNELESAFSAEVMATPADIRYDAYAPGEPVIVFGAVAGDYTGTLAEGDGVWQYITEGPNGKAGMASLEAQYLLYTPADPAGVTALSLHLAAAWTGTGTTDGLLVHIWNTQSGWEEITAILADGVWHAPVPASYIGSDGNLVVLFTDTEAVRREIKDTLSVDLLYARVSSEPVWNRPPVAVDDAVQTTEDTPVSIDVLTNDSDPDGDPITIDSCTLPGQGTVELTANQVSYTPAPGSTGLDTFTYAISDGQGGSASADVSVTVTPVGQQTTIRVTEITTELTSAGKNWKAIATITVRNGSDEPVADATVTGNWSLNGESLVTGAVGVSDAAGTVVLISPPEKAQSNDCYRLDITGVSAPNHQYDESSVISSEASVP